MEFVSKNLYSNIIQQKFSIPSNLISSKISFEIKFEGIENLEDESILKSFYFFLLIFGLIPSFKGFSSKYHLGKTFYNFKIFLSLNTSYFDVFFLNLFNEQLSEPHKLTFNSNIFYNNLNLSMNDLKNFYLVESNPHFFKWEKDLVVNCFLRGRLTSLKTSNLYFFFLENLKSQKINNL
jgi:hypothetical protein